MQWTVFKALIRKLSIKPCLLGKRLLGCSERKRKKQSDYRSYWQHRGHRPIVTIPEISSNEHAGRTCVN
jgi:hypothetical protein